MDRDLSSMTTEGPGGERYHYSILQLFPFTSERKRMGIIVRVRPRDSVSYIRSCVVSLSIELITFLYANTTVIQIIARMGVYGSFILCGVCFVTHMFACCM